MNLMLKGARVLVTAGAAGIGRTIVEAFCREGAVVFTCDIDQAALDSLDPVVGRARADVSDREQVAALTAAAVERLGGLDILVNNAGISGPTAKVDEMSPADWDRCVAICLTGQFNCIRLAVPHLRLSRNASIVNMSSAAGQYGFAMRTPYAAAKWGVIGLTKSLAIELGDDKIRVNAILPGIVEGARQRRVLEEKASSRGMSLEDMQRVALS